MTLKQLRQNKELTQKECAQYLGIPLRTYVRYESNENNINSIKRDFIIKKLNDYGVIDENNGILELSQIKDICNNVFENYEVEFCYLFGSYAKGSATETSDVDLLISTSVTGMRFFGLVEELREALKKKVDLLDVMQLNNNQALLKEILKDGVKIYG